MPNRHASAAQNPEIPGLEPDLRRVSVLLPLPLSGAYDYVAPAGLELAPGDIVRVPLGQREVYGVVWERDAEAEAEAPIARARLKEVRGRCDVPPLTAVARRFLEWLAAYSLSAPGSVLRMALNVTQALEPPRPVKLIAATGAEAGPELRLTAARRRALAEAGAGLGRGAPARPLTELARAAGVSTSVIKGLQTAGLLEVVEVIPRADFAEPDWRRQGPELSPAQTQAATALCEGLGSFSVTLLDGVTGSGKTEVYFEAIAAALAAGRQCLVMLPEIALSAQWLGRFVARFGVKPALWHSDLSTVQRRVTWRAVAEGDARVVVGARSALFLPYRDLGLVVIDEEHDRAFKQEDGVVYHARDMAVVRARLGEIPIVLASATPSLETVVNVKTGRYARLHLPERHGQAELPEVRLVDLRQDQPERIAGLPGGGGQSWLSAALRAALGETLAAGEQALLFLNRRGYAPLTLCRACGHRLTCPHCTAWLVEHRLLGRLQCHHCGLSQPLPKQCPACDAEDSLVACGPGVERLAEEVATLFPDARQAIMASDTMSGPAAVAELVAAVEAREVDLLIGTQVAAKGHHFPFLTLVGVIDADLGLYGGDLRAAERTFQTLHQVAGRAGRAQHPGRVLIQTHDPSHPVMTALAGGDRDRFMEIEAGTREDAGLPPFGRLAALVLSAPDARLVDEVAGLLARRAPTGEGVEVLGPAPAPLAVLRGRHRRRFLLRTRRDIAPQGVLQDWLGGFELPNQLRLRIDIDPYSFL